MVLLLKDKIIIRMMKYIMKTLPAEMSRLSTLIRQQQV